MRNNDIVSDLLRLSEQELLDSNDLISNMDDAQIALLTIEACRSLDYWYITNTFGKNVEHMVSEQDFNVMCRGWNPLLKQVLPRLGKMPGIPLLGSSPETIWAASSELHRLGRHILLKRMAELVRRGLAEACVVDGKISLRMKHDSESDHFLDQIDDMRWDEFSKRLPPSDLWACEFIQSVRLAEHEEELNRLMFRWETPQGVMVGYGASPELDTHYIGEVFDHVSKCRHDSGMHPDALIKGIRASDIHSVLMLLVSARLKHTQFVAAAKRRWPDINYWMSMTIWKPKGKIVAEISEYTGMDPLIVSPIIDLLTISSKTNPDLSSDVDPLIPFFIRISERHLLEAASVIFLNPFDLIARINPDQKVRQAISEKREGLMLMNLNGLFQGNRYARLNAPVRLKTAGRTLTDIDGAILDRTTGELALFQLKWQDFKGATLTQAVSRAKNFTSAVSSWAQTTLDWIDAHGLDHLLRSLRMPKSGTVGITRVYLFAVGQMNARFRHYGYQVESENLAITTWSQFLRLRHEIGPVDQVISELHDRLRRESTREISTSAIPYEMQTCGSIVKFENMWNKYE